MTPHLDRKNFGYGLGGSKERVTHVIDQTTDDCTEFLQNVKLREDQNKFHTRMFCKQNHNISRYGDHRNESGFSKVNERNDTDTSFSQTLSNMTLLNHNDDVSEIY